MFDEKNNDRNDALGRCIRDIADVMLPPAALEEAAKAGVPYRKYNEMRAGVHVRRFSKAVLAYAACVVVLLGTVFVLPRLFESDTPAKSNPVTTSDVSGQYNPVTDSENPRAETTPKATSTTKVPETTEPATTETPPETFGFVLMLFILTTVALGVILYVRQSSHISPKCNSDSKLISKDSKRVYLTIRRIAIDLLNTILIELFWVLAGVGISGYLTINFLNSIFGGWAILIPVIFFGLLTLLLTAYLKPKWYNILLICAVGFLLFPNLQNIFSDGFFAWEMTYHGGALDFGRVVQFFFWNGTFILQTASLVVGKLISVSKPQNTILSDILKIPVTIGAKRNDYLKLGILILVIAIYCAVQIPLMMTLGIALATIPIIGFLLFAVFCKIPDLLIIFLSYKLIDHRKLWYISLPIQLILYSIIVFSNNTAEEKWYVLLFMVLLILAEQFVGVLLKRGSKK